jgi:hypothetical protein
MNQITTVNLNEFPQVTQDEIRETLKCYRGVYVFRENGQFRTSIGIALSTQENAPDHKSWHILSSDIYTEEERDQHAKAMPDMSW